MSTDFTPGQTLTAEELNAAFDAVGNVGTVVGQGVSSSASIIALGSPILNQPLSSGWTIDNGGSVTIAQSGVGPLVYTDLDITSGDTLCVAHKAVPAGSWTYSVNCDYQLPLGTNGGPASGGLFLGDGSGKYISLVLNPANSGTPSNSPMSELQVYHHSSSTSFSAQATQQMTLPNPIWLRIVYDSATPSLTYQWSINGITWNTLFVETGSIFLTPTVYGFGNDMHNNSTVAPITLSINNLTIA